jgi:flagellar biosynthesis/type III secretory pathway chaperone
MTANPEDLKLIQRHVEDEIGCYRELIQVVERERDILLSGDHSGLPGQAEAKLGIARRLQQTRQARQEVMSRLSPDPESPLRLRDLAGLLPAAERGVFRALLGRAQSLADNLAAKNQNNQRFVQEALDTVEHLMGILSGQGRGQTYGQGGRRNTAPSGPPRLLAREV